MTGSRVAVVTGGSRGIGRAIASRLAHDHDVVVLTYHRAADAAEEVVAEIEAAGVVGDAIAADLSDPGAGGPLVAEVVARHGGVDTLVNNAGGVVRTSFVDLAVEDFVTSLHLHLTSVFVLMQAVVPVMEARGGGAIINIGSPAGLGGGILGVHYSAPKAALLGLTRQAAPELAPRGIRVNVVEPAAVETDLVRALAAGNPDVIPPSPMGRLGEPREVAEVVAFLASPGASYVSAATVLVSGGR